jgi:polyferredoxin
MQQVAQKVQRLIIGAPKSSSQTLRFYSQLFSLVINVWIGVQFWLWVRYIDGGATGTYIERPPGVEGWLPISSLVSLRYWWHTGIINDIHPAGLIIFVVILATAFVFKKGFCGWICPVGFISELTGDIGEKIWKRRLKLPRWLDWPLRSLKYILFGLFVYFVFIAMSAQDIAGFLHNDYNVVADILMLRFFTDISFLALSVIAGLFLISFVIRGFWCRYLCPYGALLGLVGLVSPTRIQRIKTSCIDCSACARTCPAHIKVDKHPEVVSDECIGCMACVDACPVRRTLDIKIVRPKWTVTPRVWAAALLIFFWGTLFVVKTWGPWQNAVPTEKYVQMMPGIRSGAYQHPR